MPFSFLGWVVLERVVNMDAQNSQHERFAIRVTSGTPGMRSSWSESDHAHHGVQGSHVEHVIIASRRGCLSVFERLNFQRLHHVTFRT